jgi:acyl-ACP thioesterase
LKKKDRKIAVQNTLANFENDELLALLEIGKDLAPKVYEYEDLFDSFKRTFDNRLCTLNLNDHMNKSEKIKLVDKYLQLSEIDKEFLISSSVIYWVRGHVFFNLTRKVFHDLFDRVKN